MHKILRIRPIMPYDERTTTHGADEHERQTSKPYIVCIIENKFYCM